MMELKQVAESITMLTLKKSLLQDVRNLHFKNQPTIWAERIESEQHAHFEESKRKGKQKKIE